MCVFLKENNILFERQKKFDWLGLQSLDFYLPKYSIGIECQGRQHFIDEAFISNTKETLNIRKERDERKKKLCDENNIKLIYYSNLGIKYPYNVYENKLDILTYINSLTEDT